MTTVSISQTLPLKFDTTAGHITKWLESIPTTAKVTVESIAGDRPGDLRTYSLKAHWTQELET